MGRRRRMAGRAGQSDQWARESAVDPLECSARDCKGACVCVFLAAHLFQSSQGLCRPALQDLQRFHFGNVLAPYDLSGAALIWRKVSILVPSVG